MLTRRSLLVAAATMAVCLAWFRPASTGRLGEPALPDRLSDAEFWQLATTLSEPNGFFRSDNLVSNEAGYQSVVPGLQRAIAPGGVYLGVGPEQNFTYIAAIRPSLAFIVDIRRGNRDLQLMYKALFELSADRVDFVARLFARPRPDGLAPGASPGQIFAAFERVPRDTDTYTRTLAAIQGQLVSTHHLPLSQEELDGIEQIYGSFARYGPGLHYSSSEGGATTSQPTFADLIASTDDEGRPRSFLANDASYQFVKDLEARNLIVPIVGDFGGPTALRGVAAFLSARDAPVSVFYLSNVEPYLRQDGRWEAFCGNVSALPLDASSTYIRAVRGEQDGRRLGGLTTELGSLGAFARACL